MMMGPGASGESVAAEAPVVDALGALAFLTPEEARGLIARCTEQQFAAGEIMMDAGASADYMGFVLTGKVVVKKASLFPGRFTLLAELEPGAMVGEGGMVSGEERGLTVVAAADTRLLLLSRREFLRLVEEDKTLALKLMARIVKVMRHRLHSAGARLSWIL